MSNDEIVKAIVMYVWKFFNMSEYTFSLNSLEKDHFKLLFIKSFSGKFF